jgi:alpha-ketoglutarate-dependent taurine dioxygenase
MGALQFRELTPTFGAEVLGVDPASDLDATTIAELCELLDQRLLLLFRDAELDLARQRALVRHLARDDRDAVDPHADVEQFVSNRTPTASAPFGRLPFHIDMMWADEPYRLLSLYAVEVEQPAVPTQFASAVDAWETLPDDLRARATGRRALHMAGQQLRDADEEVLRLERTNPQSTTTLLGHPHPFTGQTMLYLCQMTTREILDMAPDDGNELMDALYDHLYRPEALWSHEWRQGDLLVWDNLALQHARSNVAADGPARTLRKVPSYSPFAVGAERPDYGVAAR